MWGNHPTTGDWVRITSTVPTTLADHITGSGLPAGTKGVVTARVGGRVTVDFDTGYGIVTRTVDGARLAVTRRSGGYAQFTRSARVKTIARVAVALFLIWPLVQFAGAYLWREQTTDGLVESLTLAAIEGAFDFVSDAIAQPGRALLYMLVLAIMSRFAFGR